MSADDLDYEVDYEPDDFYDDLFGPPKEEPDCGACCDSGYVYRSRRSLRRTRKCGSCNPTRFQIWRWSLRHRYQVWRHGEPTFVDQPPF